ncbi:MAG TPA: fluoride efflux transporter CrcB [Terriglobia bacterium]|nr:fluoride efflux transporter CrcB [Terriglobia bacterium]
MTRHTFILFVIFVGGGIGSMARHAVNQISAAFFGVNFGWGTLFVNILGSFLMGVLAGWFALKADSGELLRLFLTTGILGGFTTFSAFSLDAALLWQRGQIASSIAYIGISVIVSLVSLFAGLSVIRV